LWDQARRGHGQRVVVRGYAGLGKSRLLEEFVRSPKTDGAVVLWIRARRGGREHPMAFLSDLVQSMASLPGSMGITQQTAAVLVGLVPSLRSQFPGAQWQEPPSLRHESLTAALRELLATLAEEQPILLILDDVHWADAASVAVIHQATDALDGIAACLVASTRPRQDQVGDTWEVLNLGPLSPAHQQTFVQGVTGARIDAAGAEMLQQIGVGNPLHTLQASRLLIARGVIQRQQEFWVVDREALRTTALTTQDLLAAMIGEQSAAARRVLVYLALADAAVATATLERVLAGAVLTIDVLRALDEADLAQPLDGARWRISHDLVADLVLHQAPVALRRELSLDLAVHAEGNATVADMQRVVHWYLDADAPDAMIDAVRRWAARTKPGPKGAALADLLLGAGATPAIRARLVRAVPERSRFTIPIIFTVLATTVCLI
ncbi:MAG: AAA family ATPase, partial [Bacteroidota bacterium]